MKTYEITSERDGYHSIRVVDAEGRWPRRSLCWSVYKGYYWSLTHTNRVLFVKSSDAEFFFLAHERTGKWPKMFIGVSRGRP
jgi:hypothetical protein